VYDRCLPTRVKEEDDDGANRTIEVQVVVVELADNHRLVHGACP
jgi:hypothetical protein